MKCQVCGRMLKNPFYQQLGAGRTCLKRAGIVLHRWREWLREGKAWTICRYCEKSYLGEECPFCPKPFASDEAEKASNK